MFFGKKKKEQDNISFKRVCKNMSFAIGIVWKYSKLRVIYEILSTVIGSFIGFLSGTWLTRYILNSLQMVTDNKIESDAMFGRVLAVFVGIYGAQLVVSVVQTFFTHRVTPILRLKVERKLKRMLFDKVLDVELACYEDTDFYKRYTMTVPEATGGIDDYVIELMNTMINTITQLITNTYIVLLIDPVLIALAIVPLVSNLLFGKKSNKLQFDYQMQLRDIKRDKDYVDRIFYLGEYAKEIRLTEIYKVMMKRFYRDLKLVQKTTREYGFKTAIFLYLTGTLLNGNIVYYGGLIYATYRLLISHAILVGDCIVITSAISSVSYHLGNITGTYIKMHQHSMFLENLRKFMNYMPRILSNPEAPKPDKNNLVIDLRNVNFRYDNTDHNVLNNISLQIKQGERVAVVGANGAGKSTLVKLIMRLYDVTDGIISCGGVDIRDLDLDDYRSQFGVIFQDYKIFAMSVRENVLLGDDYDDETVIKALKNAGVYDKIMSLPNGIDTILTREFSDEGAVLSGGELQKICIARVFARNAGLVILDEPSSALDPIAEYEMYENMLRACEGRSVIFISHRLSSAVLADKVVMIDHGEIIGIGPHEALLYDCPKYAEMFNMQAENYVQGEEALV